MPHRVKAPKRYRVADDVLILILQKLAPVSLYRTCQAFQRAYRLVMNIQSLRYVFELAVVGMKDGPAPLVPAITRLQLLMSYRKEWPKLIWTDEQKLRIPAASATVGVSGGFLYYASAQTLDLVELPSCRTGRPPSQTRHLKYYTSPPAQNVVIDPLQSLIVAGHTSIGANGQINLRLKIRNLLSFDKHPRSTAPYYDCSTHINQPIDNMSISVCGSRLTVSLDFAGGLSKHLLLDWCTLQAMWLEEHDVILLNPMLLLGVRKVHGKIALYLYNISDMRNVTIAREYELPPIWAKSAMRFGKNTALNSDGASPNTIFYSDPSARVLLLIARHAGTNAMHWMFIQESFFRPTPFPDRRSVPWSYWSQFCLIRDLQANSVRGDPEINCNRVVYLEEDPISASRGQNLSRLSLIDFSPYADIPAPPTRFWTLIGKQSSLRPIETNREFSPNTTSGLAVEAAHATEDNIVVVLEIHRDIKPVNVLTFGVPTTRTSH